MKLIYEITRHYRLLFYYSNAGFGFTGALCIYRLLFSCLSVFACTSFINCLKQSGPDPNLYTGLLNGIFIFVVFAMQCYVHSPKLLFILPVLLSSVFIQELYKKQSASPFSNIAFNFLGMMFTVIPFTFFHSMAFVSGEFNFHLPLGFLLMLWANDTGAYLTGTQLGRTKLFERHSPKKTWEGFIGGIVITAGWPYIISRYFTEMRGSNG
jgi:phosphatidate cytidylyltransferase